MNNRILTLRENRKTNVVVVNLDHVKYAYEVKQSGETFTRLVTSGDSLMIDVAEDIAEIYPDAIGPMKDDLDDGS